MNNENDDIIKSMEKMEMDMMPPPPAPKKKGKKAKKDTPIVAESISGLSEMYKPISNPAKLMESPLSEKAAKQRDDSDKKKKKKKSKKKTYSSSVSSQSVGGFSGISVGGFSVSSPSSSSASSSSMSSSRRREAKEFNARKRHEEIMQEKFVMLTRISKMSRDGITARKKFSMKDDINDIRFECYRMTREKNSQSAIKTMHMVLITIATIIEKANGAFNPFNLNLNGFSQNMMLSVSDYDDSLEEIHHKWSGKTYMGPEMSIMFTFITSAIFFHVGNGGNSSNQNGAKKSSSMPPMMNLFSSMFSGSKKKPEPPVASVPVPKPVDVTKPQEPVSVPEEAPKKRKTMKRPSASPFAGLIPNVVVPPTNE